MAKGKYKKWLEPENLTLLEDWARNGLTDEQIAQKIGIARSTLSEWKNEYPDISDALKKGKETVDAKVENALLKRALGYEYTEVRIKKEKGVEVEKTEITKEVVPDTTAQIFWLKNRRKEKWREKQQEQNNAEALKKLDSILEEIKEDAKRSIE
jgi:transcriptional regulator with XRE-family HTH domain